MFRYRLQEGPHCSGAVEGECVTPESIALVISVRRKMWKEKNCFESMKINIRSEECKNNISHVRGVENGHA